MTVVITNKHFVFCFCHLNFSFSDVCLCDLLSPLFPGLRQVFLIRLNLDLVRFRSFSCSSFVREQNEVLCNTEDLMI